jgi:hypothetical protein
MQEALEAALLAAETATAALGSLRLVERATSSAAAVVAIVVALVAVPVVVAPVVRLGRASGVGASEVASATATGISASTAVRVEIAPLARGARAVFGDVEAQRAPADRTPVELLNCLLGVVFFGEPNECEAPRATRFAVLWNVNVNDLTDFTEDFAKLFVGRGKVEVPYEYLV